MFHRTKRTRYWIPCGWLRPHDKEVVGVSTRENSTVVWECNRCGATD